MRSDSIALCLCLVCLSATPVLKAQAETGRLEFTMIEQAGGKPLPSRIHLKDAQGRPVRANNLPYWRDHFVCDGNFQMDLPGGEYSYEVERGPEYQRSSGAFTMDGKSARRVNVALERLADIAAEGWWSGDLHVHRPTKDIELLMQAEDLHVAPVMTWWNNKNQWAAEKPPDRLLVRFDGDRFYHLMAGEDEREGGALLYFNLDQPLAIAGAGREYPSPMKFLEQARRYRGVWVDIEKPFWWDVPIWLASGKVDSIGLANNHMCRDQMYENEAWGKPRDAGRLPAPRGNGFWTQEIYYQILNCGLRLPPSAGSASGVLPNPVGYDRVYVHLGRKLDYEKWWEGLRAGRSFVSNGPLLRCRANGQLPGHVFKTAKGKDFEIEVSAALAAQEKISNIEIIKNGLVERALPLDGSKGEIAMDRIKFNESGWFLVRAIADNPKTFRFASTAPFYVEAGGQTRISKASAQFFLDWARERAGRVKLTDPAQRQEVLQYHEVAQKFWQDRINRANAD